MITILTGDKINAGDLFIVIRGMKLLKHFYPNEELLKLDRWKPIDKELYKINKTRALILLGGPAFQKNLYPGIYPLVKNLDSIKVPIIAMGLGSKISPYNHFMVDNFKFTKSSKPLLYRLTCDSKYISVRDYITKRILENNGVKNSIVTGCPAWYNFETLGKPIINNPIETIALTTSVRHFRQRSSFIQQYNVMKFIKEFFPRKRFYCVFQDSLENDTYKPPRIIKIQRELANKAEFLGYKIINCTNNVNKMMETYEKSDLLIGYRVHSHICMLTLGKPSILIADDSRGYGVNEFLNMGNFNSYIESKGIFDQLYVDSLQGIALRRIFPYKPNKYLTEQIRIFLEQEISNGFASYAGVNSIILRYFKIMETFMKILF